MKISSVKLFSVEKNQNHSKQKMGDLAKMSTLPMSVKLKAQPMKDKVSFGSDCAQDMLLTPGDFE